MSRVFFGASETRRSQIERAGRPVLVALRVAMSGFSGAVKLGDLDDFINPSQSCVVALNGDKLDLSAAELAVPEGGEVLLRKRGVPSTASTPPAPVVRGAPLPSAPGEAVKVSLSDCLACSGCVTSAETVLLEAQSAEAFKRALREASEPAGADASAFVVDGETTRRKIRAVVVTVAPQSRASLAAVAGLDALEAARRLTGFFKSIGVARVFDAAAARDVSLLETGEEFCARFAEANLKRASPENDHPQKATDDSDAEAHPLPVLSSACPGFVCYAEKTHGPTLLKHISAVKSPQAVMGTIVKSHVAEALGVAPDALFHASVMPCFDKKLEASRADFSRDVAVPEGGGTTATQETDCVLTTGEVAQLIADAAEASGETKGVSDSPAGAADAAARARAGAAALARAPRARWTGGWRARGRPRGRPRDRMDTDCGDALTTEGEERISVRPLGSGRRRRERWVPGLHVPARGAGFVWGCGGGPSSVHDPARQEPGPPGGDPGGGREDRAALRGRVRVPEHPERRAQVQSRRARRRRRGRVRFRGDHGVPFGVPERRRAAPPPPARTRVPAERTRAFTDDVGGTTAKALVDELEELYHTGGVRARGIGVGVGAASRVAREPGANRDVAAMYETFVRGDVGSARAKALWHTRYHDRSAEAAMSAGGTAAAAANLKITSDW